MRPRFIGQLGPADVITVANAALGFMAAAVALGSPHLAARLILLAAIADALDGIVARHAGSTPVGAYLDSLADVASFGIAPALVVVGLVHGPLTGTTVTFGTIITLVAPALFVAMAVVRLGMYMAHDSDLRETVGVQTTLAATLIAATVLAEVVPPVVLLVATVVLAYLMVACITYPDLRVVDAVVVGGVQALAVAAPNMYGQLFPRLLLAFACGYFLFAPWVYWRDPDTSPLNNHP